LTSKGALSPLDATTQTPRPYKAEAGTIIGHPLVPSQSLLGVEGAALQIVLTDVLSPIGARDVRIHVEGDRAFWCATVDSSEAIAAARSALSTWLTTPLTARALDVLAARARGLRAREFSEAGAWAKHQATGVLAFGGIVDDTVAPSDLSVALRARIFPEAIRAVAAKPSPVARAR
jgi:hypothetical protein